MVQPILNSMQVLGERPLEVAATARRAAGPLFQYGGAASLCRHGFVTGSIMALRTRWASSAWCWMVAATSPGVDAVVSVQIFDHVEALEYADAHRLAAVMLVFAFAVLMALRFY